MVFTTEFQSYTSNYAETDKKSHNLILFQTKNDQLNIFGSQFNLLSDFPRNTYLCSNSNADQFELTPYFGQDVQIFNKLIYVSTLQDTLRMISNGLITNHKKCAMTFIGSDLRGSSKVSYFFETTKKITLFSNLLGHQKHLNGNTISGSLNSLPLGSLKQNIIQSQISIEESQFVFFNINALKYSDAPGQIGSNPSGISSEEANQLAYLAGRSTKNKFFIFYGLEEIDKDQDLLTHNLIAQMSWYYLEGSKNPVIRPEQIQNKQEYYIESSLYSDNLKYIKDLDTGLWFHKIPFELSSEYADYQWILSNHQEYIETSNEDIPYRLLEMYDNLKSTF